MFVHLSTIAMHACLCALKGEVTRDSPVLPYDHDHNAWLYVSAARCCLQPPHGSCSLVR